MEFINIYAYNDTIETRKEVSGMGTIEKAMEHVALEENRENRVWARLKCDITTDCYAFRDRWACKIIDLSERGLGIVSAAMLQKGAIVNFNDPRAKAQVVWVNGKRAGLKIIN